MNDLGFGIGLRSQHYKEILATKPKEISWFEIISENYMVKGGPPLFYLDKIREFYPIVMHGVSLSIGSTDPLNLTYLKNLKELIKKIEPSFVSDHLCWTGINGINTHDLLPLPYTEATLQHVVNRVKQVQDFLGMQILLENPSSYIQFPEDEMPEWEFLREVANLSDCLLLLDINNIYVSSYNHKINALDYINAIPKNKVKQFHLAGHLKKDNYIIDTHSFPIIDDVWELYKVALEYFGIVPTLIERDANIPPLADLIAELKIAKDITTKITNY